MIIAWIHDVLEYLEQKRSSPFIPIHHSAIGTMSSIDRAMSEEEIYRMDGSRTVGESIPRLT